MHHKIWLDLLIVTGLIAALLGNVAALPSSTQASAGLVKPVQLCVVREQAQVKSEGDDV